MANILCLETATTNCSVTLSQDGSVIAFREDNKKGYSHAEKLHVFIDEVLTEAKVPKSELDAIAVSKGPGSYTGLRIGVSAAKGLCYALDIPLISVDTLQSLAMQVTEEVDYIIPLLDARRMEVYTNVFDRNFTTLKETQALVLTPESFSTYTSKGKVAFIGNGVEKFRAICKSKAAVFIEALPSAKQMNTLATEKYKKSDIEDVAYFEPYYLKDFIGG